MNDFYSGGVQSISFSRQAETLVLSWVENGVVEKIPLGFERPLPFVLDAGGNRFEAACFAQLCSDEDEPRRFKDAHLSDGKQFVPPAQAIFAV